MRIRFVTMLLAVLVAASCASGETAPSSSTTSAAVEVTATTSTTSTTSTTAATTTTLAPIPVAEPLRGRMVIHAVGDIIADSDYLPLFRREGYDRAFDGMGGLFLRDQLTIANLECSPSELGAPLSDKEWAFRCDPAALPAMARAGIDVAGMGNNHSADFGYDAMLDGRSNLETTGLRPVGAGADLSEANRAQIFEIDGWTVGVVAFSAVSGYSYTWERPWTPELDNPWFASDGAPGISPARFDNMTKVVAALDAEVDIVIVSIHQEPYNETNLPLPIEIERAEALVDAGADAVVAHHHHRLLPFEYLEGVPIFWGMGNFVWRGNDAEEQRSAVAEIVVDPDGTITGRLIPVQIEWTGRPVLQGVPDPTVRSNRNGWG